MKVFGDLNMFDSDNNVQNRLHKVRLGLLPDFPDLPRIGNIVFKDKKLYIYAEINTVPIWIPLTSELVYYTALFTNINPWVCVHGLAEGETLLQVYDGDNKLFIPDDVDNSVPGVTTINFASNMTGRIFIVQRLANADRISVFAVDQNGNFITDKSGNYLVTN